MGLLSPQQKKAGLLSKAAPVNYTGTPGDLSALMPSFSTKTSTPATSTINTGQILKEVAQGTGTFLKEAGQGTARGYLAVGQGIVSAATGGRAPLQFTPSTPFEKAIAGTDKPFGLQEVGEEVPFVPKGSVFAPAVGGLFVALDLTGAGGGIKGLKGLKTALKAADTVEEAATLMRGAGFADDIIKTYAPVFAKSKDATFIEKGLLAAEKLHNTTVAKGAAKTIPDVNTTAKVTPEQAAREAFTKNWNDAYGGRPAVIDSPTPLRARSLADAVASPLAAEARVGVESGVRPTFNLKTPGSVQKFLGGRVGENFGKPMEEAKFYSAKTTDGQEIVGRMEVVGRKFGLVTPDNKFFGASNLSALDKTPRTLSEVSTAPPTRPSPAGVAQDVAGIRPTPQSLPVDSPSVVPQTTPATIVRSLDAVKQVPENLSTPFKQAVEIGAKTTKEPSLYARTTKKLGDAFTSTVEYVQNADERVRKLVERPDLVVTDANNAYQKATLYPGRVATKIENARAEMETLANELVSLADLTGRDVSLVRADVNEYLQAVHAPERNAVLGDGAAGITNEAAAAALKRITEAPGGAEIKRVAEQARKLNEQTLVLLRDAGVITDDLFNTLTTKYKYHVPLQRVFEGEDFGQALSVQGFDVRSTGVKKAKGSEREVADIMANIQHNYEQAVLRSEKNIVDQATLAFVRDNRDALKGLMDVYKPRAIGKGFDGKILMERTTDPSFLQLYENGKPVWIKIHDPALATALRGVGREKLPTLLNAVGAFTRFYAGLATRFKPDFAFPNKLRDLQETMIYMAAQPDVGFKGAAKVAMKDPASLKAVGDAIRGTDSAGARMYKEMQSLGGTTGGFGLSTRKQTELNFDRLIQTASSRPRQAAADVFDYIDNWNTIFEDSTRLSVYRQALSQGLSKERAAFLAKEASINFNRMGRGGPVINALWMFANASIQGSAKMIRSLKNPKVAAAVITTVGAATAAVNEWNDRIDPEWRDKVTKWDRLNGLPVVLPNEKGEGVHYFTIPVSWGVKPIKVMADYAYDAASGRKTDLARAASDLFASVADAYNPLGGTDAVSALTPSVLDVPVEIARNQSWSGAKIRPDFDKNAPKDVQYFSTLNETALGKAFIEGTKGLQAYTGISLSPADVKYAFEQYIGGAGQFGMKTANTVYGIGSGEPVPADEYPFLSRFYRQRTQEEVGLGAGGDTELLKQKLETQSRERFYEKQAAEEHYTRLKDMPKAEARAEYLRLAKESPGIAAKINEIADQEAKGLTYTERLITQLGVKNGERSMYVLNQLNELKTREEKAALWKSYVEKGIITAQVADQLEYMMSNGIDPSG